MTQPSARVIADSITSQGHRLVTMEVVMHRFILAEMNTHRDFSRNSASSRAIPFKKIKERVQNDSAVPVHFGLEKRGMQSGDLIKDLTQVHYLWDLARTGSLEIAQGLADLGLHKSLVNRLLEPFMWHTAIISATEWDNFFWQRCHPDAQPEMKAVADEMQRAYFRSEPVERTHGQWHLPYIDAEDELAIRDYQKRNDKVKTLGPSAYHEWVEIAKRVSTARCARVSYLTHDGKRDIKLDMDLYDKLFSHMHWSPFEHVATPIHQQTPLMSNFVGWKQFRKEFRDERRTRFVPNLPDLADVQMKLEALYASSTK